MGWLKQVGLEQYHDRLVREGYETLSDLQTLTADDLRGMYITKQMHVKKILGKIETEKGMKGTGGTKNVSGENEGLGNSAVPFIEPPLDNMDEAELPPAYGDNDN